MLLICHQLRPFFADAQRKGTMGNDKEQLYRNWCRMHGAFLFFKMALQFFMKGDGGPVTEKEVEQKVATIMDFARVRNDIIAVYKDEDIDTKPVKTQFDEICDSMQSLEAGMLHACPAMFGWFSSASDPKFELTVSEWPRDIDTFLLAGAGRGARWVTIPSLPTS